jgi:hypothetical protein
MDLEHFWEEVKRDLRSHGLAPRRATPLRTALGFELIGSSSGAYRVSRPAPLRPALECEFLEVRIVPAGGTVADLWTDAAGTGVYGTAGNWVNTALATDHHVPLATDDILFDPTAAGGTNDSCTTGFDRTVNNMTVQHTYVGTFVVSGGATLTVNGTANLTNGNNKFEIDFGDNNSAVKLAGGGSAHILYLNGGAPVRGQFRVTGGTFSMDDPYGYCWTNVYVDNGGTMSLGAAFDRNNNTHGFALNLGASLTVATGGTLMLFNSWGKDLIWGYVDSSSGACGKLENSGTVKAKGGVNTTVLNIPVLNHGSFTTYGGNTVEFKKAGLNSVTDGYAFKQDGGTFYLTTASSAVFDAGYKQTGGDFNVDASTCVVELDTGNRIADFEGGTITFGGPLYSYGLLWFKSGDGGCTVNFHGVGITQHFDAAGDGNACDRIWVTSGQLDIDANATWRAVKDHDWTDGKTRWYFIRLDQPVGGRFAANNATWPGANGAAWQQDLINNVWLWEGDK